MSEQQKTNIGMVPSGTMVPAQQLAADDDASTIDLVDLFYRLLSKWKLILCLALVFAIASGVYTIYFVTPMYQATAIIYVLNSDSILNVSSLQLASNLTSDYLKVFDLWEVHEEVISNLNLNYSYGEMRKMLSVTNTSGTRMLDITFTSPSPAEAATVANEYAKVVSNFIHETMAVEKPSIMSVALEPANPVSPSRTRNIMLGFILGGMLGAGIVVLIFLMDDKIKTTEDIRKYAGLVTLAVVPIEDDNDEAELAGSKKKNRRRES